MISSPLTSISSTFSFNGVYSNGSINAVLPPSFTSAWFGGLLGSGGFNNSNPNSLYFSAVKFEVEGGVSSNTGGLHVGGLAANGNYYPSGSGIPLVDSTDYVWRFVKDRDNSSVVRHVGNMARDSNNDGLVDDDVSDKGRDMTGAGITESQLMQAGTFTGRWVDANSPFDITEGEYPVLKNMPYPHTRGASWLSNEDPGVAHQRATYNDYVTQP